ncbi:MAG: Rieske 2Fe-2S domain-containing protein [Bacillota bacterium]
MAWHKLCKLEDVPPGKMRECSANGIPIVVVRGDEGFIAIPPTCPHMDNPLAEGFFDGCILTCSKHLWQWSIPGGEPIGEAEVALLRYPTEARDGDIWVEVDRELEYDT